MTFTLYYLLITMKHISYQIDKLKTIHYQTQDTVLLFLQMPKELNTTHNRVLLKNVEMFGLRTYTSLELKYCFHTLSNILRLYHNSAFFLMFRNVIVASSLVGSLQS